MEQKYLQFTMSLKIQKIIILIHEILIDEAYKDFGDIHNNDLYKPEYSLVIPSTFGSARRKPVHQKFQEYCEEIYFPIITSLYFGIEGWAVIKDHLSSFKINTMTMIHLVPDVYHMHLDAKIGEYMPKNKAQKHVTRILTSFVPLATKLPKCRNLLGCTVYPKIQPDKPFLNNKMYHKYMCSMYDEEGLSQNKPRPLYKIEPHDTVRLLSGEVAVHPSHTVDTAQPIHSEPNPNPIGGRYALIWDFVNIIVNNGKNKIDNYPIPLNKILTEMNVLETENSDRIHEMLDTIAISSETITKYRHDNCIERLIFDINQILNINPN
jgi:hypothetical protein